MEAGITTLQNVRKFLLWIVLIYKWCKKMFNVSGYMKEFFNHKLFDKNLFNDFKLMSADEVFKWNSDFLDILTKSVPFTESWNNLIDVQKGYFNSWLALNVNFIPLVKNTNSQEKPNEQQRKN